MEAGAAPRSGLAWRLWTLAPILLLALVVGAFVSAGTSIVDLVGRNPPAADVFDIGRIELSPGEIRIRVRNPQPEELTIASVTVDDAIVPFTLDGPATLKRLRSSTIVVPVRLGRGRAPRRRRHELDGIETVGGVAAAIETPSASARGFLGYGLIGFLVGVVPVALGLLWLPSLRRADPKWLAAFMALTGGLLSFLAVESLAEAFTLQALLPGALGGAGLVLLGVALSALGMTFLSSRLARGGAGTAGLALALLVAIGIGVHNLGEGLAIGTSFAFGELQLGTFLIVGFMIHNVTEGLAIAAPATEARRVSLLQLLALAMIAGGPAILGTWIGGYATSDVLGVLFFAAAAGAALQVVFEVGRYVARRAPGGLRSGWVIGGYLAGIAAMYLTGLLVG